MNKNWEKFAHNIKELYKQEFIPLHEPTFNEQEVEYVTDCIKSGWVSSVGAYVSRFEEDLANFVGVKRAVAVVNGTAALQIALKVAGVKPNDEVLMPSLTFIATANAVSYLQAVPHFVDVNRETLGIDPDKLSQYIASVGDIRGSDVYNKYTNRRIKAIVPMHTFGHPCMMDELISICDRYNITLVEDAAESLGSYYKGKHTGTFGKVSAVSFNGNKIITTGGGGAILTNDESLADYAKHLTTTAKAPHKWAYVHDEIGYNYRMPNLNAALGCAQLEKMNTFVTAKRHLTEIYEKLLMDLDGVDLFVEPEHCQSNYWLQTIVLDKSIDQNEVLHYLNEQGVMCRPIWLPIHKLAMYEHCPKMNIDTTESLERQLINIPSSPIGV